jgi:hypothetical protein
MSVGKCSCMTDIPHIPVGHGDMDVMERRMVWIFPVSKFHFTTYCCQAAVWCYSLLMITEIL